jgi:hypothetical protein
MRITGLSLGILIASFALPAAGLLAADDTPLNGIANLATALSESDPDGALRYFDSQMKDYPVIEMNIEALTSQTDISCLIDIVKDDESDGVHTLDLDWFMQLKAQSGDEQLERRRERVQVEMRLIKGRWKVTKMAPLTIFDPIRIR